jgi:hypothetical protein
MNENPHFATAEDWAAGGELIGFEPLTPTDTAGYDLDSLRVHVMDYQMRQLPPEERTLEAHYGGFVFTQSGPGASEARRLALEQSYGAAPRAVSVGGREARAYDEGPKPEPDDPDGQMPALVVWADQERFFLIAGADDRLKLADLFRIANSVYG